MNNEINFDEIDFEKLDVKDFGKLACTFGDSKDFHDDFDTKLYEFVANMKFSYKSMFTRFNVAIMDILHWFQYILHKYLKISTGESIYERFAKKEYERSLKNKGHDRFFKFIDHINNIMEPCGICYEKPGSFIDLDDVESKLYSHASDSKYVWRVGYDSMSSYKKFIKSKPMKLFKNVNLLQLDVMVYVDKKCSHIFIYAYTMDDNSFEDLRNTFMNNETLNTLYSKGFRL